MTTNERLDRMEDIDWKEAMHVSRWYTWKHLKRYSIILGSSEIVSEAMLYLVRTPTKKWSEMSLTTLVYNNTRWAASRLYDQHKKHLEINGNIALPRESYEVDFNANLFREDIRSVLASAKSMVVNEVRTQNANHPASMRERSKKLSRYESGFLESKVIEQATLDTLGHNLGITRERARQIESKFWNCIRNALVQMYELPLEHVGDLLIAGEVISDQNKEDILLKE